MIHDYHHYQPSRSLSDTRSMAGKQGGIKSGEARRSKREAIALSNNRSPVPSPPVPALPDPSQPDGSEDLTSQLDDDARPGWLARSKELPRKPGEEPQPRTDELAERLPFAAWAPSQKMLDWAKEKRLPDAKFDAALIELRDKCQGLHDVAWWDLKAIAFIRNAIAWHENPKSKSVPVQTSTGLDDESAALLQRLRAIP